MKEESRKSLNLTGLIFCPNTHVLKNFYTKLGPYNQYSNLTGHRLGFLACTVVFLPLLDTATSLTFMGKTRRSSSNFVWLVESAKFLLCSVYS